MRASRLVTLLLLLQTRGQLTAAELASELEVSERTIHRDVDALSESGVPIYAERGPHGGIRLVDGYRTRLTGMTARRGRGALPGRPPGPGRRARAGDGRRRRPAQGAGIAAARAADAGIAPRRALPPRRRRLVQGEPAGPAPGCDVGRRLELHPDRDRLRARRRRGATRRSNRSGVVLKAGIWYVVARVEDQIRTYRVSRVVATESTGERFERPDGFDLAGLLGRIRRRLRARRAAHRGRRASPRGRAGPAARRGRWHRASGRRDRRSGGCETAGGPSGCGSITRRKHPMSCCEPGRWSTSRTARGQGAGRRHGSRGRRPVRRRLRQGNRARRGPIGAGPVG